MFIRITLFMAHNIDIINKIYQSITLDFYNKIVEYSAKDNLINGFYKNKLGNIDFYLFM